MPHIIVEYSSNLEADHNIPALIDELHDAALESGLAPLAGLRTRAAARPVFKVATADPSYGFVAILARIGPGRTPEQKKAFVDCLLDAAEASLSRPDADNPFHIAFSAEVQEIDAEFRVNRNHIAPHIASLAEEEPHG